MRTIVGVVALCLPIQAMAEPRIPCDLMAPTPQRLCADRYSDHPELIQICIQSEMENLKWLSDNEGRISRRLVEECGYAGCKAAYYKIKTVAECIRVALPLKDKATPN